MGKTINRTSRRRGDDRYFELVRTFPLRRLSSRQEYDAAQRVVLQLSQDEEMKLAGTADYLDVLVDLVMDYEKRKGYEIDRDDLTAADVVNHLLMEREQSVSSLARELGVPQSNLSDMLNGRREWSKSMIIKLRDYFGLSADLFLR